MADKKLLEITPDGKQEIVEGKEPLKKDPKKLKDKWKTLKKGLNNMTAIMDMAAAAQSQPQQAAPQEGEEEMDPSQMDPEMLAQLMGEEGEENPEGTDEMEPQDDESADEELEGDESSPEDYDQEDEITEPSEEDEEMESGAGDHGAPHDGEDEEMSDDMSEEPMDEVGGEDEYQDIDLGDEDEAAPEAQEEAPAEDDEYHDDKVRQALLDEGYSEPEIAYIMHGQHSPAYDESKQAKAHATYGMAEVDMEAARKRAEGELSQSDAQHKAELETRLKQAGLDHSHAQRMKDLEYQHAAMQAPDPETEKNHKKRMLDLEYENAKSQSPDSSDKEHQKRMMDLEYQRAMAEVPDPEIAKKMASYGLA